MDFEKTLREIVKCGSDKAAEDLLENIKKEFGSVPLIYRRMARHPEVLLSHLLYKNAITETSTLDPKYIELISLAVGAALNCNHCVEYHMNGALRKGASRKKFMRLFYLPVHWHRPQSLQMHTGSSTKISCFVMLHVI